MLLFTELVLNDSDMKTLPVELRSQIFLNLPDTKDILSLCLVSHTFHREAERALYHTVVMPYDYFRASCFLSRILDGPRQLALYVRVLTLNWGCRLPDDAPCRRSLAHRAYDDYRVPAVQEKLAQTLRLLRKVNELHLVAHSRAICDPIILCSTMLLGCPFRLHKLRIDIGNGVFYLHRIIPFLYEQPDIRDITTTHFFTESNPTKMVLPDTVLCNVIIAQILVVRVLRVLRSRSIKRLFVEHWDARPYDVESFGLFAQLADTLTHLRVGVRPRSSKFPDSVPPDVLTSALSLHTPNLKFLHLDFHPPNLDSEWITFFRPLSTLKYFEVLIVDDTQRMFDKCHRQFDDQHTLVTQDRALEISKIFFNASPSLRRVAWVTNTHLEQSVPWQEYPHLWYNRDGDGDSIEYGGIDETCNDAWRML